MNNREFITVAEYSNIKKISRQAVYKQLSSKLSGFVKVIDGQKFISIKALDESEKSQVNRVDNGVDNQVANHDNQPATRFYEKQIEEKDKTIESLLQQLKSLQEQNGKLTDLNGKLTEIINNNQVLLAYEKKLPLTEGNNQKEEIEEDTPQKKGFLSIFRKKK